MKKLLLFALICVSCSSCGDIILKEKVLSERPFDPVYNYQAYILAASDNNVFLSVQKNAFDRSQLSQKCSSPYKFESLFLTTDEAGNKISENKQTPLFNTENVFSDKNHFYYISTYSSTENITVYTYSLDFQIEKTKNIALKSFFKNNYTEVLTSKPVFKTAEDFAVIGLLRKPNTDERAIFWANIKNEQVSDYTQSDLGNIQYLGLNDFTEINDNRLLLLVNISGKTESESAIYSFEKDKKEFKKENSLTSKNESFQGINAFGVDNVFLPAYSSENTGPIYYIYDDQKKTLTKKTYTQLDGISPESIRSAYIQKIGDKYLFSTNNYQSGEGYVSELRDDQSFKILFKKKATSSQSFINQRSDKSLRMFELSNGFESGKVDLIIHKDLNNQTTKNLYEGIPAKYPCFFD